MYHGAVEMGDGGRMEWWKGGMGEGWNIGNMEWWRDGIRGAFGERQLF